MTAELANIRPDYECALSDAIAGRGFNEKELAYLLPHLEFKIAVAELQAGRSIALPPFLVRGAYWQLQGYRFPRVIPMRTPQSFGVPMPAHGIGMKAHTHSAMFINEALAFAEATWPAKLINDTAQGSAIFELYAPESTEPTSCVYAWLTVRPDQLRSDRQLATATINVTYDDLAGLEIAGWTPTHLAFCGGCGTALQQFRCYTCNVAFQRMRYRHSGTVWAMPGSVVREFENKGHSFV